MNLRFGNHLVEPIELVASVSSVPEGFRVFHVPPSFLNYAGVDIGHGLVVQMALSSCNKRRLHVGSSSVESEVAQTL